MTALEAFFPFVLPFAPACPDPLAEQCLRIAATEFCQRTRLWRAVDRFATDGQPIDVVVVPAGASLFEIERAWFNDTILEPARFADVWRPSDTGQPRWITQVVPGTLHLVPPGAGEFRISMILVPDIAADELPDFLFTGFAREIAAGAIAQILMLPGQTWTSPELAAIKRAEFSSAMDRNFAANLKGQQRAAVRTRPGLF